jgi:hypothetical protein
MKKSVITGIILVAVLYMIVPVMAVNITEAWNVSFDGGNGNDVSNGIDVDSSGNVYVAGYSNNGADNDYLTVKFDSSGNYVWNVTYDGGQGSDVAYDVAVDSSGNVYVTGYSDTGPYYDLYTIKYDTNGNEVWNVTYSGGEGNDVGGGVDVDDSGNVYVAGQSRIGGNYDFYTIKYDSSGNEVWNASFDDGNQDYGNDVAVDSSGNVYVTGKSGTDYVTVKFDSSGNYVWNATYNSGNDEPNGVDVDDSGNVYVTGSSNAGSDYFYHTIKYDSSGNEVWSVNYDDDSDDRGYGIAVDSSGNVYVTGYSNNGVDQDFMTIKYNSSADEQWTMTYDSGNNENGAGIYVDNSGNVYVTGSSNNGVDADVYTIKYSETYTTQEYLEMGLSDLGLSYSSSEKDGLESLYNNATGNFTAGSETWFYSGDAMAGRSLGEGWESAGAYYIKLGSGITTQAQGESSQEGYVNVSITTTLAIEVIQEDVDFGEGAVDAGESNAELYTNQANAPTQNRGNWTLPNAYAIEVRNVGNINCSLDVGSSKTASSFLGGTNPEYQWKVSDKESGSCSGGLTHGSWYDVNSSARLCQHLSPINSSDEIFLDIRVVVPYDANPTDSLVHKTDILTLTASATA